MMNNYINKDLAFKTIKQLIEDGLKLMNNSLTESELNIWIDYSQKILELSTKNNPTILFNYLKLALEVRSKNIQPYQKLSFCIEYLIEMLKVL
jgi:preprotein translocase subunit Sec63